MIWARIEIAISAGEDAPRSSPMGPLIRAQSSSLKPILANLSSLAAWVRLLPNDPI